MMVKSQTLSSEKSPVSQEALELASKGHKKKHKRKYSFGMMSIHEGDEDLTSISGKMKNI